ncbi:MAG: hypothetical protein HOL02_17480 [Rhodospirillaceae bacterium]|nr:hypothetical protein [Rhodospirillaceae bacterium]
MATDRHSSWMTGPLGGLILRPWFDRLALAAMVKGYFPLSRLWAAAEAAGEDAETFFSEVPMAPLAGAAKDRLQDALKEAAARRSDAVRAEQEWRGVLFDAGASADPGATEKHRRRAIAHSMHSRGLFRPWRKQASPVRFSTVPPAEAHARFGHHLQDPPQAFQPESAVVEVSRPVASNGVIERWLRFDCPHDGVGGTAWAHVFEPEGGFDHTIFLCHGVGMEAEVWGEGYHMAPPFVARGLRVIEPEAPWHSRRRPLGHHGGEPFMANGLAGAIEMFGCHVREIGALVGWAHETSDGKVAVGGISLGALNSQLAVAHAGSWPEVMRPDAALFVTTTDRLDHVAWDSGFSKGFKGAAELSQAGWTREISQDWLPLLAPVGEPGIAPDRIVMALGTADNITPYASGGAFAKRWRIPPENLLETWQGHFSKALGLGHNPAPIERLCAILRS